MLESHPTLSAELVAVIPFQRVTARGEDAEEFGEYLRRSDFHRVIVTHTDDGSADMIDTIRIFKSRGIKVSVLPSLFEVLGSAVEFDELGGTTLLGVRRFGLSRSSQLHEARLRHRRLARRLIALAPLFAALAVADQARFARARLLPPDASRPRRHALPDRQVPHDAQRRRGAPIELLDRNETRGLFKIADDPRITGSAASCAARRSTSCRSC